jgi:IS5 family transposase
MPALLAASSCSTPRHCREIPGRTYAQRDATRKLTGFAIERAYVDKGYDTTNPRRVFISGQKRGVFGLIKRELRCRSAIEAVIGHMKTDGHLGRCYLKGREGAANVILSAVGYNLRPVLAWLRILLSLTGSLSLSQAFAVQLVLTRAS